MIAKWVLRPILDKVTFASLEKVHGDYVPFDAINREIQKLSARNLLVNMCHVFGVQPDRNHKVMAHSIASHAAHSGTNRQYR